MVGSMKAITMLLALALGAAQVPGPHGQGGADPGNALTDENRAAWVAHIQPAPEELAAESIDWIPSFARGVHEASRAGRPLLFWAMNGHPLGCT